MKKSILIAAAALLLGTVGASFAQTQTKVALGAGSSTSATNQVTVAIPKFVILQVQTTDGNPANVAFDFTSGQGLADYQTAIQNLENNAANGTTLPTALSWIAGYDPSSATNLKDVRVLTNSTLAPMVSMQVSTSGAMPAADVLYKGSSFDASAYTFTTTGGTGWQTLINSPADFAIQADDTVAPAAAGTPYTFTVTYTAVVQ